MKTGTSSLNPHAASYVPLFKRGVVDGNKEFNSAQGLNTGNDAVWFGNQPDNTAPPRQHQNVSQSNIHSPGAITTAEFSKWKDHHGGGFLASTSQYPEKSNSDEDFEMDLAFLQMHFPGISGESISDVYLANRCDVEAAQDMLSELEIHPEDSSHKLPDTLDIGDVPESVSFVQHKVENAATAEAGTSASASSNK